MGNKLKMKKKKKRDVRNDHLAASFEFAEIDFIVLGEPLQFLKNE